MVSLQTIWFLRERRESPEELYAYLQKFEEVLRKTLNPGVLVDENGLKP